MPAVPANAATTQAAAQTATQARCRVVAAKPQVTQSRQIRAVATRTGCAERARVRVRIVRVLPGPDRIVKSGSTIVRNGRIATSLTCVPGTFFTIVADTHGHISKSTKVRLTCETTAPDGSGGTGSSGSGSGGSSSGGSSSGGSSSGGSSSGGSSVGTELENEVVRLTNAERAKAGCGALTHDAKLRAAAVGHSADMSAKGYFSHTSQDGRSFSDRIKATGFSFTAAAENIAKGYPTAAAVVQGWMDSPGHRQNMLNCAYTHIGVGHAAAGGPYWTQDFAKG
ncbi:CAP domain-containing protein [Microtetraspora sp. AC03309]|nr:CAP domain-containing protein [Microtetraspora sp. AC03309]